MFFSSPKEKLENPFTIKARSGNFMETKDETIWISILPNDTSTDQNGITVITTEHRSAPTPTNITD